MTDKTETENITIECAEKVQSYQEKERFAALVQPLLKWYDSNKRDLPWRQNVTPYRVWVSEIMLQQTRVEAGRGYFLRFMEKLPDVEDLANVDDQLLMKLWEGLGYYNRARNLKKAAGVIVEKHKGRLPASYEALLELPGVGSYTAGAIGSIAFGLKVPAVDGNVLRVLARIRTNYEDILKASVKKEAEGLLKEIMPEDRPGDFNQALMELGACVCIPNGAPKCGECPVAVWCRGYATGEAEQLPVKKKKQGRRKEEMTLLMIYNNGSLALRKRPEKGLLAGLYELPFLAGKVSEADAKFALEAAGLVVQSIADAGQAVHVFSHVEWHMQGYRVKASLPEPALQTAAPAEAAAGLYGEAAAPEKQFPLRVAERSEHIFYSKDLEAKKEDEAKAAEGSLEPAKLLWVREEELARDYALPTAFRYFNLRFH